MSCVLMNTMTNNRVKSHLALTCRYTQCHWVQVLYEVIEVKYESQRLKTKKQDPVTVSLIYGMSGNNK